MTKVISFKRRNETVREELHRRIDEMDFENGVIILYHDPNPEDDEGAISFLSNTTPGLKELIIWKFVLDRLEESAFRLEEE